MGQDCFDTVTWELDLRKPDYLVQPVRWSHRMIGGTRTIRYPAQPQRYYTRPGTLPIPFAGVNWDGDNARYEGVDCYAPEWQMTAKQQILKASVTTNYLIWLAQMRRTTNAHPFRGFFPGVVLYLGADIDEGKNRDNDVYDLTHQFIVEPNLENFYIDGIFVPFKGGHEHLWTAVSKQCDPMTGAVYPLTIQANVANMYNESDLNLLFV